MRAFLVSLGIVSVIANGIFTWAMWADNKKLHEQKTDLIWRNVTVEQRIDPHKFKGLDSEATFKASELTGLPYEIIANGRKIENGGDGYSLGYRGKNAYVVTCYDPDQWQYGLFARRMNQFAWEYIKQDKQLYKAVTDYIGQRYTGRNTKEYGKALRGQ